VCRIDTPIAQNILDRFVKSSNVYAPDNIDVLEATLDEKNTYHCTHKMVWQRDPAAQERYVAGKHILRHKAIKPDALRAF